MKRVLPGRANMRQSLQSKFNVLGALLVVFFLLMLPMFTQVKADARESAKEVKSTHFYKFAKFLKNNLDKDALGDEEVEDYWAKYGEEAKQRDPDCGADCDPDADRDGDGVSNKDEVKNGTHPGCNEKEKGEDYCKGVDPLGPPDTGKNGTKEPTWLFLHSYSWAYPGVNCTSNAVGSNTCTATTFTATQNYTKILVYLNNTRYEGTGWQFTRSLPQDVGQQWSPQNPMGSFSTKVNPSPSRQWVGTLEPAATGPYTFNIAPGTVQDGAWDVHMYGLVGS